MTNALATSNASGFSAELAEKVFIGGDLSRLSAQERLEYYHLICASLGLNPATRPFEFITLQGKLVLYARKDATEQLRAMHQVSITSVQTQQVGDAFTVTVTAQLPNGRTDTDIGVVSVAARRGDDLANAIMKAVTKAKRRVTLSICGLGMLDETELETIPSAARIDAPRTLEIKRTPAPRIATQEVPGFDDDLDFDAMQSPERGEHPLSVRYPEPGPSYEMPQSPDEKGRAASQDKPPNAATDKQIKAIHAIAKAKGWNSKQVEQYAWDNFDGLAALTKAQASTFIEMLNAEK